MPHTGPSLPPVVDAVSQPPISRMQPNHRLPILSGHHLGPGHDSLEVGLPRRPSGSHVVTHNINVHPILFYFTAHNGSHFLALRCWLHRYQVAEFIAGLCHSFVSLVNAHQPRSTNALNGVSHFRTIRKESAEPIQLPELTHRVGRGLRSGRLAPGPPPIIQLCVVSGQVLEMCLFALLYHLNEVIQGAVGQIDGGFLWRPKATF
mmetsp:Transcript_68236/g.156645  ORF Transcript_68236/g.156645 Transcript_68236/m.156645 type:complete len:205 (-) Transcript_68236:569-1183(-)